MRAIHALMQFYNAKTQAAALVMQFGYDHNLADLNNAEPLLAQSIDHFRELVQLTDSTYRDAAAMHTSQRRIPVTGGPDTDHFRDVLPTYEHELTTFRQRLKTLNSGKTATADINPNPTPLPQVSFTLSPGAGETFTVAPGQDLYMDNPEATIASVIPELNGLTGIRVSTHQKEPLHFTLAQPAQILVGFFKSNSRKAHNVSPATEQWNILLPNAIIPTGKNIPITVWSKPLAAGRNDLDLGEGAYIVLGFIPESTHVTPHIASTTAGADGQPPNLDWLFED
jgi:hypothetical protein